MSAYQQARAAWPTVLLDEATFEAHLAARAGATQTDDLYLACACLRGDPAALTAFDRTFAATIAQALAKYRLSDAERDDIGQKLRLLFFVQRQLEGYSGRGALGGWVRAAATREALQELRRRKQRPDDEDLILGRLPATGDVELDLIRGSFKESFKSAFTDALAGLDADDRSLLALHYVDDLSIDELARVLGLHRATAARRVAKVRDTLLAGTRDRLHERLQVGNETLDTLMREISSQLHVSVFKLLKR
jgi:RNA polymerase sigma-70 factor (ECF subfamily)